MAARLAIDVAADVASAVTGLDKVGTAATRMGDDVDRATTVAANAAPRLDSVASAADNVDDKAGRATGALGALSAGFELVGAEKYAGALQGAAMATDFFSGVGQAAKLAMEAQGLATAKARVQAGLLAVQTKVVSAATRAYAAVQWVLNAALNANPIGIVVVAVAALVAGIIIAYKKSETFRDVVDTVMRAARTAVGWVVDKVTELVGWVKDKLPPVFKDVQDAAEPVFGAVKKAVDIATTPIRTMIDLVQDLIGWIGKIDFPDIPDIPFVGRSTTTGSSSTGRPDPQIATTTATALPVLVDASVQVKIDGSGIVDEAKIARVLQPILDRHALRIGKIVANPRGAY